MKQYQSFTFDSYAFDPAKGKIALNYSLDDEIRFTETLTLPPFHPALSALPSLDRSMRALHLASGISYFKTCLPKKIEVRTGDLTAQEAAFWNTVYEKGLGEFFYRNEIDFRGLIRFPSIPRPLPPQEEGGKTTRASPSSGGGGGRGGGRILVPVGGGKDSTVTIELLKEAGYDCTLLRVGGHPLIERIAETAGLPLLTVSRSLPKELFALNAAGALNGHVPITMVLSFLAIVVAELEGFDAVVWSNERSASVGNATLHGMEVNHQWSKSLEAEQMLRSYIRDSVGSQVESFSLLRPLSELSIAKRFAALPQYFDRTTSCNRNWKITPKSEVRGPKSSLWCCSCPKCTFVFTLLAAFLPKDTLLSMFGKNLFETPSLLPLFRELLGLEGTKPFECVGTPEEMTAALLLAKERKEWSGSAVMNLFEQEVLPSIKNPAKLVTSILEPSSDHCIPHAFQSLIL